MGRSGLAFLRHGFGAVQRILPHTTISKLDLDVENSIAGAKWGNKNRTQIKASVVIPGQNHEIPIVATIARSGGLTSGVTLNVTEFSIIKEIAERISQTLTARTLTEQESAVPNANLEAIRMGFDETIVAAFLAANHSLEMSIAELLGALHSLAEQSYENKSIAFGCIIDPAWTGTNNATPFPKGFLNIKKYKALTDGYRTAYHISKDGHVIDFLDIEKAFPDRLHGRSYAPEWARHMAKASRNNRLGL